MRLAILLPLVLCVPVEAAARTSSSPRELQNGPSEDGWPRFVWRSDLELGSLPDVRAAYSPGAGSPAGTTSLDVLISPARGVRDCQIGISSGNAALDAAACRIAQQLDLIYTRPCTPSCPEERLPLQFVWRPHDSYIRFPLPDVSRMHATSRRLRDPADPRTARFYRAFPNPLPRDETLPAFQPLGDIRPTHHRIQLTLLIDTRGRVARCFKGISSGNLALDERACQWFLRERDEPRTDVFGDPAAIVMNVNVSAEGMMEAGR